VKTVLATSVLGMSVSLQMGHSNAGYRHRSHSGSNQKAEGRAEQSVHHQGECSHS